MAKSLEAPYEAGRRGAGWVKVKRANTLDLVVLAAEWGNGRRQGWLSNLHLGARDADVPARMPNHSDRGQGEPQRPRAARFNQLDGPLALRRKRRADPGVERVLGALALVEGCKDAGPQRFEFCQRDRAAVIAVEELEAFASGGPELSDVGAVVLGAVEIQGPGTAFGGGPCPHCTSLSGRSD